MISRKSAFRKSHRLLIDLSANMASFWFPKTIQILPKINPKMHQFFDRFLHRFFLRFGVILGPKLEPCWPHSPPKWVDAVASPSFLWGLCYFSILDALLPPSWRRLSSILEGLGRFGSFWCPFWRWAGGVTRSAKNFMLCKCSHTVVGKPTRTVMRRT